MAKLGVGLLLLLAAAWSGVTMQRGCQDAGTSLTHLGYYPVRDMRRTVAITPNKVTLRAPDSASVPVHGLERVPEQADLIANRDAATARFVNTVAADDSSLARGERMFGRLCVTCHGKSMSGDGPTAPKFMPPPDLLGATTRGRTDGFIYSYIRWGGAIMPKYGHALSARETWDVINYLRRQQRTTPR